MEETSMSVPTLNRYWWLLSDPGFSPLIANLEPTIVSVEAFIGLTQGPGIGQDDADHRPAHSPVDADVSISTIGRPSISTTARSAPTSTISKGATQHRGTEPSLD
ncbi:hypothetical protein B296_00040645 [Ensete ventricosum]|uniref:Uncharacterized protein n=1 Tax=Ensete ventricosum TaxID=4639 RepID=A0A426YDT5_ENSVE|nr:hypothetical protein B296_00040645 [Ensete ventricosum]